AMFIFLLLVNTFVRSLRPRYSEQSKKPGASWPGLRCCLEPALDGLQICRRQLTALAHHVVAEVLPLVEVAHAGALDRGNMDKDVLPAIFRLYEAKALLGIEKLDRADSHTWP